jgi:putative Mn2+ efflux pump MntP
VSTAVFRVLLVALSLGLDVFAVSIGVGVRGVPVAQKVRIGLAFAAAEVGMTVIGVLIGSVVGKLLGEVAGYIGYAALIGVGIYMIVETLRDTGEAGFDLSKGWGLFLAALSISLDSLGIGFSIVYIGVPLPITLATIGVTSIVSTTAGLAFGKFLGARVEAQAGTFAGIVLILTGLLFAAQHYFGAG